MPLKCASTLRYTRLTSSASAPTFIMLDSACGCRAASVARQPLQQQRPALRRQLQPKPQSHRASMAGPSCQRHPQPPTREVGGPMRCGRDLSRCCVILVPGTKTTFTQACPPHTSSSKPCTHREIEESAPFAIGCPRFKIGDWGLNSGEGGPGTLRSHSAKFTCRFTIWRRGSSRLAFRKEVWLNSLRPI